MWKVNMLWLCKPILETLIQIYTINIEHKRCSKKGNKCICAFVLSYQLLSLLLRNRRTQMCSPLTNSENPDLMDSEEAIWSGSIMFAYWKIYFIYDIKFNIFSRKTFTWMWIYKHFFIFTNIIDIIFIVDQVFYKYPGIGRYIQNNYQKDKTMQPRFYHCIIQIHVLTLS